MKRCSQCGEEKSLDDFYREPRNRDGRKSSCKKCEIARTRKWQREHPEEAKALQFRTKIMREYGLTVEEYEELICEGCSICHSHEKLHVDHDHADGRVRGALCHYCNVGLGVFKDNPERLRRAIEYLEEGVVVNGKSIH